MFLGSKTPTENSAKDARQALIHEETRFLLQGNNVRFSKQLQARLLEEGCNLPLAVASPLFYRHLVFSLTAELSASAQASFARRFPESGDRLSHPQFHAIMRFLHSKLSDAKTKMARASIEAVADVMATWYLDEASLTDGPDRFEMAVRRAADRIIDGSPVGRQLAELPFDVVVRRLRLALTASLLRHVRESDGFRSTFGSIPRIFSKIQGDPAVFSQVMSFLQGQLPYFGHVSSQVFWRTLNHLNTDRGASSKSV